VPQTDLARVPWRTGTSPGTDGRTIYACPPGSSHRDGEVLIGMLDTRELAQEAVEAHNAGLVATDRMAKMDAVVTAAREALRHGEHEGSCTNVDEDGEYLWDTCDLHLTAARRRETALIAALSVLDGRDG
jgi:hypothetical protein